MDKEINKQAGVWTAIVFLILSTVVIVYAANTFDSTFEAVYRFESLIAMGTDANPDGGSANNLVDNGNVVGIDLITPIEGLGTADFEADDAEALSLADASLITGFPTKSGEANKTFSIHGFMNVESKPTDGSFYTIAGKWNPSTDKRSWRIEVGTAGTTMTFGLRLGSADGTTSTAYTHTEPLAIATRYHYSVTYNDTSGAYVIDIRDTNCADVGASKTGTASPKITLFDSSFNVGSNSDGSVYYDGKLDEMAIRGAVSSTADGLDLCQQDLGGTTTTSTTSTTTTTSTTSTTSTTTTTVSKLMQLLGVGK